MVRLVLYPADSAGVTRPRTDSSARKWNWDPGAPIEASRRIDNCVLTASARRPPVAAPATPCSARRVRLRWVLNLERWPDNVIYSVSNVIGGALATAAAAMIFYWPTVVFEGAWFLGSVLGTYRILHKYYRGDYRKCPPSATKGDINDTATTDSPFAEEQAHGDALKEEAHVEA
eukprot:ctg_3135.g609